MVQLFRMRRTRDQQMTVLNLDADGLVIVHQPGRARPEARGGLWSIKTILEQGPRKHEERVLQVDLASRCRRWRRARSRGDSQQKGKHLGPPAHESFL